MGGECPLTSQMTSLYRYQGSMKQTILGVLLSEDLRWNKQVHNVVQKVSKVLGILYRIIYILNLQIN